MVPNDGSITWQQADSLLVKATVSQWAGCRSLIVMSRHGIKAQSPYSLLVMATGAKETEAQGTTKAHG